MLNLQKEYKGNTKKILPNRPEINLFEDKLDKLKEEKIKKDLLSNFNIASSNDDWETSLLNLKKIETIESNDAFIREKIEMTEEILSLKKSLKSHSKNLHRLTMLLKNLKQKLM